jgi:hypothetical protein
LREGKITLVDEQEIIEKATEVAHGLVGC